MIYNSQIISILLCTFANSMNLQGKMGLRGLCFVLMMLLGISSVFSQDREIVKGRIISNNTSLPLENACVHNISTGMMTFSNQNGDFVTLAKLSDTVTFSHVSYDMRIVIMDKFVFSSDERLLIRLAQRAFILRSVTIYAMKPYPMFLQDIAKEIPSKKVDIPGMEISKEERADYNPNNGNLLGGTPLASPISFLYNAFSHKAQLERQYAELIQNQEDAIRVEKKYNPEIVQRLTNLEGKQLEEFMVYCSFTYYTLVTSSDQEIKQMIVAKYIEYKREYGGK